ncbi:ABC transporter substrate-binding protein [archaeon]|nr:ABC transporter substrate-binding protein [archaeon]NCP79247.1 ABC transporter substrate-binding protein [archaeon]NCP97806.1 ABC transporter substrate-binding protein [archaeon]NCQ07014.1 ABC transporter substrate-binding protein [archaeon]NCQ50810.1 ABC transporter substrate-binding protein [archaeon]
MKLKFWVIPIIIILIIIGIFIFNNNSKVKSDIIIGYSEDSFGHSPIFVGKELGLFEKQGIIVEYVPFSSTKYSRQAVSSNQVNLVTGGANNFIDPISKGINIKFIAPMALAPSMAYVRPNDILTLKDLNNTSIATRVDSTSGYVLNRILKENNLDIQYTYVDIENAYTPLALVEKKIISAALKGAEGKEEFFKSGAIILPEWEEKGYDKRYFLNTSLVVNTDYLEGNPEVVEKFIDGYIESHRFMVENPDETYNLLQKHINAVNKDIISYSKEEVINSLSLLKFNLWVDLDNFLDYAIYAQENNLIDVNLTIDDLFDKRFEEKLKNAQYEIYKE